MPFRFMLGFPNAVFKEVNATDSSKATEVRDTVTTFIENARDESNQLLLGRQVPLKYMVWSLVDGCDTVVIYIYSMG